MAILVALFGLVWGSFLNVVGLRLAAGGSLLTPPSHCPNCQTRLRPIDLFPVASFFWLGGKCRYCRAPISVLYPVGELATALLFLAVYARFGWSGEAVVGWILVSLLLAACISDLSQMTIPNGITAVGAIVLLLSRLLFPSAHGLGNDLFAFFLGGGILYVVHLLAKEGMGMGDVKLMAMSGLALGWEQTLLALFLASAMGALTGSVLLLTGRLKRRQPFPFGPFLAGGAIVSFLFGDSLFSFYTPFYFLGGFIFMK